MGFSELYESLGSVPIKTTLRPATDYINCARRAVESFGESLGLLLRPIEMRFAVERRRSVGVCAVCRLRSWRVTLRSSPPPAAIDAVTPDWPVPVAAAC